MCLTSKSLHDLAQHLLYRMLHLAFVVPRNRSNRELLQHVLINESSCISIRELQIHWFPSIIPHLGDEGRGCLELLIELLPRLSGLKNLIYTVENAFAMENLSHEESHWDDQHGILPWLVDGLNVHHPNCRLSVASTPRQGLVLVLGLLAQSSNLYSLTITLDDRQKLAFNALLRVASTYPNLRNLSITSHNIFGPKHFPHLNANDSTCLYLRNQGIGRCIWRSWNLMG